MMTEEEQNEKLIPLLTDDFLDKLLKVYLAYRNASDWSIDLYPVHEFVGECFSIAGKEYDGSITRPFDLL